MLSTKCAFIWGAAFLFLPLGYKNARAQSEEEPKIEIGMHMTMLRHKGSAYFVPPSAFPSFPPFPPPDPLMSEQQPIKNDVGLGGRFSYVITKNMALEAEVNHFPRDLPTSGNRTQFLFGAKIGKRFSKFGIFGKARPGFMRFGEGRYLNNAVFEGLLYPGKNVFAFDVGGVVEVYHSKRLYTRVDLGDTMIRPTMRFSDNGGPFRTIGGITHNLQISVGFGMRF